ncbi:hypothetical protein HDG32_006988 [Paraburkholderia sp. CI2]|nr:hypothetical protein [Paraburkholderia sp. CI2]
MEFIFDLRHQMQAEGLSLITVAGIYQPTLEQFFGDFEKNESWRKLSLDVFRRDMSFSCVSNQDDLRLTLECVDLAEDGRGQSWVQFFLPMAYAKGFRLANMTDALFGKLSAESKWLELGFPSGAVFAIIRKFLSLATHHDGGSCSLDGLANDILNSVFETSGFRAAMADKLSADVYNGHI